jgi:hypothetical protein
MGLKKDSKLFYRRQLFGMQPRFEFAVDKAIPIGLRAIYSAVTQAVNFSNLDIN